MGAIGIGLCMLAGPFCGAGFKKKFGETLSLSFGIIMILLYGFYVIDCVKFGFYTVIFLLGIGSLMCVVRLLRKQVSWREFSESFFSPSF